MELNSYLKPILIFPETNSPITPALSFCSHNTRPTCECKAIRELAQEIYFFFLNFYWSRVALGLPRWLSGKAFTCQFRRHGFDPWVGKIPWSRK